MTRRGWLLFAAVSFIWGIPYFFTRIAVRELEPVVVAFGRAGIGMVLLLPIVLRAGRLAPLKPKWRWLVLYAIVQLTIPWFLLSDSGTRLPSSLSGLLVAGAPILGFVVAIATRTEKMGSPIRIVGLLMGLGGILLLSYDQLQGGSILGVLEVVGVVICFSISPVIATRHLAGLGSIEITAVCLTIATAIYAVPALLNLPDEMPSAQTWWCVIALGVLCSALAYVLFLNLISEVGPSRAGVIGFVNPIVAIVLGVLILNEPFTPLIIAAAALVLVGSFLATLSRRRKPDAAVPEATV